jgi:2,3-bisphosphoglycerate-dependent phosphoglycerate mutase
MITYLVRHGRTELSSKYLVNGDPGRPVGLDEVGLAQARRLAGAPWTATVATCMVSEFGRTAQTARLVLADPGADLTVHPGLNEIDYGGYEGGPWMAYGSWLATAGVDACPPGGRESRQDACDRYLRALADGLDRPGPRLVVGHGLMISLLTHLRAGGSMREPAFPEAPYVEPLTFTDAELRRIVTGRVASIGMER